MSDFASARKQILGKRKWPQTQSECERLREACTETVRHLRSAMGECASTQHILSRELTWTPPGQRERLEAELADVWTDKQRIEQHIAKVESVKTRVREIHRELDQRGPEQRKPQPEPRNHVEERPRQRQLPEEAVVEYDVERRVNPNGKPPGKERRKRAFADPAKRAQDKATQAQNAEIASPSLPKVERLIRLSELYFTGGMTEAEFTAARQRIADDDRPWKP